MLRNTSNNVSPKCARPMSFVVGTDTLSSFMSLVSSASGLSLYKSSMLIKS